jgi:MFS family permease
VLLCAVQFLDIADSAIVNVALPSIQHSLSFSQQSLQWVASGYILTYGGFLLLGGRLGDLLGRRRVLLTGLGVFAVSSLTAGLAPDSGLVVAARLVQGSGAALMAPAALSELTVSFREGRDRNTALGVRAAISGMAAAAGVFLGGVLSQGPGWRWVFFVNPPVCVMVAARGARSAGEGPSSQQRGRGLRLAGGGARYWGHAVAGVQPHAGAYRRLGIDADRIHLDRIRY